MFQEGDVFRIIVPLDESYSFDKGIGLDNNSDIKRDTIDTNPDTKRDTIDTNSDTNSADFLELNMERIMDCIRENPTVTQVELKDRLNISIVSVKRAMKALRTVKGKNRENWLQP